MSVFFVFFVAVAVLGVIMSAVQVVRWAKVGESASGVRNRALCGGFVIVVQIIFTVVVATMFMTP